jgi:GAF domain-containing protein
MDSSDPLGSALGALSSFLVSELSLGDTLTKVTEIAVDACPPACFGGISLLDASGKPTTGVFTSVESPEIDSAQYESGRGPCLDAWRKARTVRIDDLATTTGYPEFAQAAKAHGIASTLSQPLMGGDEAVGALNLYAREAGSFTEREEEIVAALAVPAAALVGNSQAYWGAFELGQQLSNALETRPVIEQAKGILMATTPGLDADGAFDMLRHASQRENRKIRDMAQEIVDRRRTT